MLKRVEQGYMYPKFYGFYRRDYITNSILALPIPINLIARIWYVVWSRCKAGLRMFDDATDAAYHLGFSEGMRKYINLKAAQLAQPCGASDE